MKELLLLVVMTFFSSCILADSPIQVTLEKSQDSSWQVTYQSDKPVKYLSFVRNPNDARVARWTPKNKAFQIVRENDIEIIRRFDKKTFSKITIGLQSSYIHLPKDYAPFSPFSDGGILIYTGRFFACPNQCEESYNQWEFHVVANENENIIINGLIYNRNASWLDQDSGSNIYVGNQTPIDTSHVIAVIDKGLPNEIKTSLSSFLPELMDFYGQYLNKPTTKPALFASYGENTSSSYGRQGGTFSSQIFMHWYGSNLNKLVKQPDYLHEIVWFFAHEAAHFHQDQLFDEQNAWIHEGGAEFMASNALIKKWPERQPLLDKKFGEARSGCINGLTSMSLQQASKKGRYDLHYSCGLLISNAIHKAVMSKNKTSNGIYSVQKTYKRLVDDGDKVGLSTYLKSIKQYTSESFVTEIRELATSAHLIETLAKNPLLEFSN